MGRDSLTANYSMTTVLLQTAIRALDQLVDEGGPFLLSVQIGAPVSIFDGLGSSFSRCCELSFHDPSHLSQCRVNPQHPPYVSSGEYMNQYFHNRDRLFVSPSISDSLETSAYYAPNRNLAYQDKTLMAELVGTFFKLTDCSQ